MGFDHRALVLGLCRLSGQAAYGRLWDEAAIQMRIGGRDWTRTAERRRMAHEAWDRLKARLDPSDKVHGSSQRSRVTAAKGGKVG
jgi:hypothetical protein